MSVRLSASVFFVIKRSVKMFVIYLSQFHSCYQLCCFLLVVFIIYFYKSGSLGK